MPDLPTQVDELFVKKGSPAIPGVDIPFKRLGRDTAGLTIQEADLGLQPDTTYVVSVWPFNRSGYAEQASEFSFPTDGAGHSLLVPSPVHSVSVTPLPGGDATVKWTYDEPVSLATADDFLFTLERLDGSNGFSNLAGPHTPPRRNYGTTISLPSDGPWRLRVFARKAGQAATPVTGVDFMADSAVPDAALVAPSAV